MSAVDSSPISIFFFFSGTNLPLGKLELGQAAALSSEARAFFQGPANGASSNGEVAVVAMDRSAIAIATHQGDG
jgi:hypothetical protein